MTGRSVLNGDTGPAVARLVKRLGGSGYRARRAAPGGLLTHAAEHLR
jgi:hypothetical protein